MNEEKNKKRLSKTQHLERLKAQREKKLQAIHSQKEQLLKLENQIRQTEVAAFDEELQAINLTFDEAMNFLSGLNREHQEIREKGEN